MKRSLSSRKRMLVWIAVVLLLLAAAFAYSYYMESRYSNPCAEFQLSNGPMSSCVVD